MGIIVAKVVVTPALMWAVSVASRRWGSLVGGLLSGLPLTSAPISVYLALEQGRDFAAAACVGSVVGIGAIAFAYLAYVVCAPRLNLGATIVPCLAVFVLYGLVAHRLFGSHLIAAAALHLVAMVAVVVLCLSARGTKSRVAPPRWDMPARLLASTALVVLVSSLAPYLGPAVSGILSPIPIISWPLIVFANLQDGVAQSLNVVRGSAQGSIGVLAFYVCLHHTLATMSLAGAYTLSILLAVVLTLPWLLARR